MKKLRQQKTIIIISIFISVILLASCATTTTQSYEKNVFKALNMAATTYENTMETIGDAYKKGMISESVKASIIEKANIYWKTYHSAVLSYEIYLRQKNDTSKAKLENAMKNMNSALVQFLQISQSNLEK